MTQEHIHTDQLQTDRLQEDHAQTDQPQKSPFNHVVTRFSDEMHKPENFQTHLESQDLLAKMRQGKLQVRQDPSREWEHVHVVNCIKDTIPVGAKILDYGGGNSLTAYHLALYGYDVTVFDIDENVCQHVDWNAEAMSLDSTLRAVQFDGKSLWPFEDQQFDVVISISVFEGIMRSLRCGFFSECFRVLKLGGDVLTTFDYGVGGQLIGDPPISRQEIVTDIIEPSGMGLVGELPENAAFEAIHNPPVKIICDSIDGFDTVVAEYTYVALHLSKHIASYHFEYQSRSIDAPAHNEDIVALTRQVSQGIAQLKSPALPEFYTVFFDVSEAGTQNHWGFKVDAGQITPCEELREASFVLVGDQSVIAELLMRTTEFWVLIYSTRLKVRGNMSLAMNFVDSIACRKESA